MIVHLNDSESWSRQRIAEWVAGLETAYLQPNLEASEHGHSKAEAVHTAEESTGLNA